MATAVTGAAALISAADSTTADTGPIPSGAGDITARTPTATSIIAVSAPIRTTTMPIRATATMATAATGGVGSPRRGAGGCAISTRATPVTAATITTEHRTQP